MNKGLIIVESPAKVKTIKKFLGQNFLIEASLGHVRDLPTNKMGVDEDNGFEPIYEVLSDKIKVVDKLKKSAGKVDKVYLAPDPDREGEAIAWHVSELIKEKNSAIHRIQFNEITASAVQEALKHPRNLDEHLFLSQQARRVLDRLVGYKISPLLWKKVKRGISAGRVQSVALRLIVERERERQSFVPEEYWVIKCLLRAKQDPEFEAELWKLEGKKPKIGTKQEALNLEEEVRKEEFIVQSVQEKERKRNPKPPFITSTLQQEASNKLRFSAKKTMTLAQRLYEGMELGDKGTVALITYMRTDSVRVAKEARAAAKDWVIQNLGQKFYPQKAKTYKSKKTAQEAHEAIRPVDVFWTPDEIKNYLSKDLFVLYNLIWKRFIASQMEAASFWDTTVVIKAGRSQWRTKGERLIFPGFMHIYSPDDSTKEIDLPPLQKEDRLNLKQIKKEQKFTQPPARYTEASLVRKLEEKGIGRPSTYAQIISTLRDRDYARMENRQFYPTELGNIVNDLLVDHFAKLMDVNFTAEMEEKLDRVAEGNLDWKQLLSNFNKDFGPALNQAEKKMTQVKAGMDSGLKCEVCGQPMLIKFGRNGEFLACSGYPKCKNTKNFVRDEHGQIQVEEESKADREKVGTCPQCGSDLVVKKARTGNRFIACSNYPKCKYAQAYSTGIPCPQEGCSGVLVEKGSRKGRVFYGCNQYPDCKYAVWNYPVQEKCPECGSKILVQKSSKARGNYLACPVKGCKYWRKLED